MIPGAGIVPRSIVRISIPIDRSRIHVCRRRVAVGNRRSIIAHTEGRRSRRPDTRYAPLSAFALYTATTGPPHEKPGCGKTSVIPTRRSKAIKKVLFMASSFLLHLRSFCKVSSNNHARRDVRKHPKSLLFQLGFGKSSTQLSSGEGSVRQ